MKTATANTAPVKAPSYRDYNRAKASFDDAYAAPTPHQYLSQMGALDYCMAKQMHPFLCAAIDSMAQDAVPATVLDVGCSYGMSAALLKTNCDFSDLIEFYEEEASQELSECVKETREFLQKNLSARQDVKVVGLDQSEPAVRFGEVTGLLDGGIARNLEAPGAVLTSRERDLVASCNLMFSAGTIGYVSDRTVGALLDIMIDRHAANNSPIAVMSILQLFDPATVGRTFDAHGLKFVQLPVQVAQRRFADEVERDKVVETLERRGVDYDPTTEWMFADVCVAARPDQIDKLVDVTMQAANRAQSAGRR